MYYTRNVKDDLVWVGADDRRLSCFEGVYGVPDGVSYNSYLLLDEKTVLFDTVDKAVYQVFFENIKHVLNGRTLDYLVISHMEPDHAYTVEALLSRYPETKIICNSRIETMLRQFFDMNLEGKTYIVKEGDTFSTGKHNLSFVMAPMVHWPEVMMTYDTSDGILFSADAFGTFGALNGRLFADEGDFFGENLDEARRYYTNIVGKYGFQVQNVLKKAAGLKLNYVCPLHGPVWRSHFGDFLEKYLQWSSYTPEEKSVCLAYASVYGHTENAANILAGKLVERGVKVRMFDTSVTPASYIISNAFRCSHLVLASTTYNAGIFVTMENLIHDLVNHNLCNRKIAILENGSWAPTSGSIMAEMLSKLKGVEFISDKITLKSSVKEEQLSELENLAERIAQDLVPVVKTSSIPSMMEEKEKLPVDDSAFRAMTYGVEVLTTRVEGKDFGCIINTACQVASSNPRKISISVIKKNYTCDMIAKAGKFNVSILTEEAPYSVFEHFGFQSGREVDKFADCTEDVRTQNGIRYIPKYTNAILSCEVVDVKDLDTQVLFIADVVEAKVLSKEKSCTYAYYHEHIKPKKNPAAEQKEGYICSVCGYFHEGTLPEDFVCPLCKHGAEVFEHVSSPAPKKQKGYVCAICGHFEPCDGELPEDYTCPLCHHGREDFEPAEQ